MRNTARAQIQGTADCISRASQGETDEETGTREQRGDSTEESFQQARTNMAADRPPDAREPPRTNFILLETTRNTSQPDEGE